MPRGYRVVLALTMSLALGCGFLHLAVPDSPWSFERLHIFLFNLCAGGAVILYLAEQLRAPSWRVCAYFLLAIGYALSAFFLLYPLTVALSVPLWWLVERARTRRFPRFPVDLFRRSMPVSHKFQQASLLCLSLAIAIASVVIVNDQYLHLLSYRKLALDVFFLGYSFPLSLVAFAVIFSFIAPEPSSEGAPLLQVVPAQRLVPARRGSSLWYGRGFDELMFWAVNVGVIVFFVFIVLGWFAAEVAVATSLFVLVGVLVLAFLRRGPRSELGKLLGSGLGFLVLTAATGLAYLFPGAVPLSGRSLLRLHAIVSLYGWNLSGLIVIVRARDLPLRLDCRAFIALHWLMAAILAPLGTWRPALALVAFPVAVVVFSLALLGRAAPRADLGAPGSAEGALP